MRVGVVGCGYWGSKHVRVFSQLPSVSQVVIIDGRSEIRKSVGVDHPAALQRPTLTDALDDVDAVVVATPPETHFEVACEAIEAGKHVLIEKPITTNSADAIRLIKMADHAGVTLVSGHTFAYNTAVWKLAEIAGDGTLGKLHHMDSARLSLGLYREDVNVLWDLAAHDISITAAVLDDVPDTVSAWGVRHTGRFSEDVATLRMSFDRSGVESTVRASWFDPVKVRRTNVVGSDRMAVYNDIDPDNRIRVFDRGRELQPTVDGAVDLVYRDGEVLTPAIEFGEPLALEATDFLECAATGRRPKADGTAGLIVVSVLEASDVSLSENGAPIAIDLPALRHDPSSIGAAPLAVA